MALNTRIIFKTVQSEGLQVTWRLLTSILFYYAGYISSKEPTDKKTKQKKNPEPFFQAQRAKVKQLSVSVMSKDWPDSMALTLQQIDDVKTSGLLGRSDLIKQLPLKTRPLAQLSASDCRKRVEHLTR